MTDDDKKGFMSIMYPLGKIYDLGIEDKFILKVWFEALSDFSLEEVAGAVTRYIKSPDVGTYKPKPADVIKMLKGTSSDISYKAWSKVEHAAKRVGSYASVAFDDKTIHRVVDDMGGWVAICQKEEREIPFVSKEFMERYRGYVSRGDVPEASSRLVGITESENSARGFKTNEPVILIGNKEKALALSSGKTNATKSKRIK